MTYSNLDGFALSLAYWCALASHEEHGKAYANYLMNDCDDNLYDAVEKWGRLADFAGECDNETNNVLFDKGAWVPKEMAA